MEQRNLRDRRQVSRGGRRDGDFPGFAPLVMVVEEDERARAVSEAILAKLRFAVAPFDSVEKALAVMDGLRPDIILAARDAAAWFRLLAPGVHEGAAIPVVALTEDMLAPDTLVAAIRHALAKQRS